MAQMFIGLHFFRFSSIGKKEVPNKDSLIDTFLDKEELVVFNAISFRDP